MRLKVNIINSVSLGQVRSNVKKWNNILRTSHENVRLKNCLLNQKNLGGTNDLDSIYFLPTSCASSNILDVNLVLK